MDYGKFASTFELTREKYSSQIVEKQRRCESSCLPLSKEKCGSLQGTQGHVAFHDINDRLEYCSVSLQDYSHLSDYDESVKGPNQVKQGNLKSHGENFENGSSYTPSLKATIKEELNVEMIKELRSLVNEDFDDSSKNSYSLRSGKEDRKLGQLRKKFLPFRGNHLSRLVIPVGPRFQAEIPQWEGTTNIRHHNIDDDFKWFGTEIWPMPIKETSTKGVGEGRPDVCSCDFPRSIDCVQQHISEARELLQSQIGTTFSSWKFDEMGEDVSKLWTMEEQKEFEYIVRLNPLSSDMDFWKLAMDCFPSKPLKSMVNYYYNVYIPRHIGKETRASFGVDDSGNDKIMDYKNGDDYGKMTTKQLF